MTNKRVVVFGTAHQLQGKKFPSAVSDPSYLTLIKRLIADETVDYMFEEACGLGPTYAEELALALLKPNRYLDVDPSVRDRAKHGLLSVTSKLCPVDGLDVAYWQYHEKHAESEKFWLQGIIKRDFESGLMICGQAHTLSFALMLGSNGFVVKSICYMPHYKLCRHVAKEN